MLNKFLSNLKGEYLTLNRIEISAQNLLDNYKYLSSFQKKLKVSPVIKSNGYGHGIVNVARILQKLNPPFFCVDSLYEAYELQKSKIEIPILITGYTNPENLKVKKLPFSFAVYTNDLLLAIAKYQPQTGVHIFVDTGMRREGVTLEDLPQFLAVVKKINVKVEGLMSHLASNEGKGDKLFLSQISVYKKALKIFKKYKINPKWIHIAATGGIINPQTRQIISKLSNMTRSGLALYGFSSSTKDQNLKPALKLITHLTQIKKVKKGNFIGYDGTFTTKQDTIVGILPIGYYDGVDRNLSNKGLVNIDGHDCSIIGRVSMNITIIDLSRIKNPKIGDEVVIYSNNPKDKNSIENAAKICKKIPYEILVNLAESTRRVIL